MCEGLDMTNQPGRPRPTLDLRGAVDLSALTARRPAPSGAPAGRNGTTGPPAGSGSGGPAASGVVIDVTDASFMTDVVQRSETVPVVLDFWADWCQPCKQLSPVLEKLATEHAGAFVLAKVDVEANPQLAQAFQVQSIPSVFAVLKGQPLPLFQGAQPEPQVRAVLTEVLRVAAANGVTGRAEVGEPGPGPVEPVEPVEEPLPPLLQEAYDAIERGDLAAAAGAYETALKENPGDEEARLGLAQVRLLERTQDVDLAAARAKAAADPQDVDAQLVVADLDLLGGHVEDAFARLIDTVRVTSGPERELARTHLVELFDVIGGQDPRVAAARLKLANALF
jgi:putative thioredoxin